MYFTVGTGTGRKRRHSDWGQIGRGTKSYAEKTFYAIGNANQRYHNSHLTLMEFFLTGGINKVLMQRVYSLEKLIQHRRSWLPSLIRDVRKSKRQQPFVFWGSVLAILYGSSSILQTLASFWSIILVYKPPSHPS
jgi:hypothetical protein